MQDRILINGGNWPIDNMSCRLFFRTGVYRIIIDACISIKIIYERLLWEKWLINWPITYGGPYCF
jgi:hypothetical protein